MDFQSLVQMDKENVMGTYGRFPVDIESGKGSTLYSSSGREYIDFTSGIGVTSLGQCNPKIVEAVTKQVNKLFHVSNLYYTENSTKLAKALCEKSGMSKAFFGNSGAEANEGLIKMARKYSSDKYGENRGTVITLKQSFHGRTMNTLMATGQDSFHNYFYPFPQGFRYADTTMEGVLEVYGDDVCAILVELIQGESGVNPLNNEFVKELKAFCTEHDVLLLVDEVQTGIGRTGTFFAFQQFDVMPDGISFAKGIAGGFPMGGFLVNEKCEKVMSAGTHGSTFGGNPVCSAAALAVCECLDDEALSQVTEKGEYLRQTIEEMKIPCLGKTRGMGLMIGIEVVGEKTNKEIAAILAENGLLVLTAGKAVRLLPPLNITKEEMDKGLKILEKTLKN